MKGGAHPSTFAALSVSGWRFTARLKRVLQSSDGKARVRSHDLLVTFCTITESFYHKTTAPVYSSALLTTVKILKIGTP